MNHIGGIGMETADLNAVIRRIEAATELASSFTARDKIEHMARQWLHNVPWIVHDGHWAMAQTLAREVALITPSLTGSTPFDRLARAMKNPGIADLAAVACLRSSRPRFARLTRGRFTDLATGEERPSILSPWSQAAGDGVVFGRFAARTDGSMLATGFLLTLDADAEAVVRGFVRPGGRGLGNAVRCAEAVYRHMIRRGMAAAEPEPELPFDPETNPLDALAAEWAALDGEPGPEQIARVIAFVGAGPLTNTLISVLIARDAGEARLAAAYRRIAAAIIEFLTMRAAHGSLRFGLDETAAEIDAAIGRGQCGFETKALFNELRERARLAAARKPGAAGGDLDKLVQRIQALRAKTVEHGCTEEEALAAAEKVAELLDRHGLNLSELDLRKQSCEGIGVETNRKRRGPIDDCMGMIALFFDCRVWAEHAPDGTLRYIFFGLPGDVQASVYLHDLIVLAFEAETATFQAGDFYNDTVSGQRRTATTSFQIGLARGINDKLDKLLEARRQAAGASSGRALVPVKESIIDQELERLGLSLRRMNASRRKVIPKAVAAGREAGERFEYRPGIGVG